MAVASRLSDSVAEQFKAGAEKEVAPERLDEVAATLNEFAAATYDEIKRKLKQTKHPPSPEARTFMRDFEKKLARAAKK